MLCVYVLLLMRDENFKLDGYITRSVLNDME
jgi:hypothetical protein